MTEFTLLEGLILRTGASAGIMGGEGGKLNEAEININSSCLRTETCIDLDSDYFPKEALESFSKTNLSEFREFEGHLRDQFQLEESGKYLLDAITDSDPDEDEAKDFIRDIVDGWANEHISAICEETSADEYDLYESIFSYIGWEAGRVFVDIIENEVEDLINLEIEVHYAFDCDLDEGSVLSKLNETNEFGISESLLESTKELLSAIQQGWFPGYNR